MANNFFLNNDPLLYHTTYNRPIDENPINDVVNQYKMLQQQQQMQQNFQQYDHIGELDRLMKNINPNVLETLSENTEYQKLSGDLNSIIQSELMSNIKWKINNNQEAVKIIQRQVEMINDANKTLEDEQRQNLNELNDYVKNYSNITFDEYKKIKNDVKK